MKSIEAKGIAAVGLVSLIGTGLSIAFALTRNGAAWEVLIRSVINVSGYLLLAVESVLIIRLMAARGWGVVEPIAGGFLAVTLTLCLGSGPLNSLMERDEIGWLFMWLYYAAATLPGIALGFAASAFLSRKTEMRRQRAASGLCPTCGYDRHGLTGDAKCPECGAKG